MKTLSSAAEFHNFENQPRIIGRFVGVVIADQDASVMDSTTKEPKWKKGDTLGYELETELGEHVNVGTQHNIKKAIALTGIGAVLGITFKGKTETAAGQPFSKFEVLEFDGTGFDGPNKEFKEALAYYPKNEL
jgi:hypothetical protein